MTFDETMIKDLDFDAIETKKIQTIGYKADHNTPCKKRYNAYPLDGITEDPNFKGMWIALVAEDPYNGGFYTVFNELADDLYADMRFGVYGHDSIERIRKEAQTYTEFIGKDGFLKWLAFCMGRGWFIRNTELMILEMIGEKELAVQYDKQKKEMLEERRRQEQERKAEAERQEKIEQERRQKEHEEKIKAAETAIKNRLPLKNTDGIILDLMRRHGVKVPLRTQGWILDTLTSVCWDDGHLMYTYRKSKNGKGSRAVGKCLGELVAAIG